MVIDRKEVQYFTLIMLLGLVIYYIFPFIFNSSVMTMGLLFFINPIYNIVSCMLYTVKFGMHISLPICLAVLFIPAVFFFYGYLLLYYCVFYCTAAFAGCFIGYPIYKRYLY